MTNSVYCKTMENLKKILKHVSKDTFVSQKIFDKNFELNQKMFMKSFLNTNICLTLAIFQKTPSFMIIKMKWLLAK